MTEIVPRAQGIRRGKFKKVLASVEELQLEAPLLAARLKTLRELNLPQPLYAALWTLHYLRVRHPRGWWGAHRKDAVCAHDFDIPWTEIPSFDWNDEERELLLRYPTLGLLFSHRAFRATPEPVHRALLSMSTGAYPLVLMDRVPTVAEVLAQQTQGKRCVTLFHQEAWLSKMILGERDPLSFAFHDLIHADHFFHANSERLGQIGFYRQIDRLHREGVLNEWLACEKFPDQLEYLMADMNSHPLHLWKCFKAICHMNRTPETVELFGETLPRFLALDARETSALELMNTPSFEIKDHGVALTHLCERWGTELPRI